VSGAEAVAVEPCGSTAEVPRRCRSLLMDDGRQGLTPPAKKQHHSPEIGKLRDLFEKFHTSNLISTPQRQPTITTTTFRSLKTSIQERQTKKSQEIPDSMTQARRLTKVEGDAAMFWAPSIQLELAISRMGLASNAEAHITSPMLGVALDCQSKSHKTRPELPEFSSGLLSSFCQP